MVIETYRGIVHMSQLDHMGHMNVQFYTAKFDEAAWHLFAALGLDLKYMNDTNTGMAAVEQTTKYMAELMAGDLLVIKSEVLELKEKTIRFKHYMYRLGDNVLSSTTELVGVHMDREVRKSVVLPQFVSEKVAALNS